jgi:hypothetical protein
MTLKAGTILDLSNSMAQAMEDAFVAQWPVVMGDRDLPADRQQMRLMFVAVAQGVVEHLKRNPDAFKVAVTLSGGGTATGEVTEIE